MNRLGVSAGCRSLLEETVDTADIGRDLAVVGRDLVTVVLEGLSLMERPSRRLVAERMRTGARAPCALLACDTSSSVNTDRFDCIGLYSNAC